MPEERFQMDVPGKGEVSAAFAPAAGSSGVPAPAPIATVVVAHGAGAGMDHPFLVGFTRSCNEQGLSTLRFNFPYMEAGRRSTDTAPVAIATWKAAHDAAVASSGSTPVWASGKSFGGRMASMAVADGMPAAGLVFLGYPLHPPGKPERLRADHLFTIQVPMLFIHGTRDAFAQGAYLFPILERLKDRAAIAQIQDADHSFNRSRKDDPREVGASLASYAVAFIRDPRF